MSDLVEQNTNVFKICTALIKHEEWEAFIELAHFLKDKHQSLRRSWCVMAYGRENEAVSKLCEEINAELKADFERSKNDTGR